MENLKTYWIYVIPLLFCSITEAQIMSVEEIDRGSRRSVLESEKQIIDMNSTLEITLSKKNILNVIKKQFPE